MNGFYINFQNPSIYTIHLYYLNLFFIFFIVLHNKNDNNNKLLLLLLTLNKIKYKNNYYDQNGNYISRTRSIPILNKGNESNDIISSKYLFSTYLAVEKLNHLL